MKKVLVKLVDPQGFHARPVTIAVNRLREYDCEGYVFHNGRQESMGSVLGLLRLGIPCGQTFMIAAEGKDEKEAIFSVVDKMQEIGFLELVEEDVE